MQRNESHSRRQNRNKVQQKTNLEDSTLISIDKNENTKKESSKQIQDLKDINGKAISNKIVTINALEHTNLLDKWINFTNNINMQILENLKEHQNNYKLVYNNWQNLSDGIIKGFWGNLQFFSMMDSHSLYSEIGDLKDNIRQLKNRLNKLEKK